MSVFAKKKVLALCVLIDGGAQAGEVLPGCYERAYTAEHLASQPAQVVREIRLWVGDWTTEVARAGKLEVIAANQGRARASDQHGRVLTQTLYCGNEAGEATCLAECDGGSLEVRKQDSAGMTFRTRYLMVGEVGGCGGSLDLAEVPGQWVSYKLFRVPDARCDGM
ncbi:hypothetical protein [Tropicibacter oceani]|uniref:Uncharacterized protein n=1 Tax=Tropicibacter oceani TaxID=3058420 RepID=A0ABY8QIK4_9RHOB|nr:hypothetical protein [Tropicibacter oceani]WGW03841.1 hypothetical protein QF118_18290 [Tropicibacter oceani]